MDALLLSEGIWQLPFPILIFILLATGVLVTKREHSNMTKQMEYFRDLSNTQVKTISDLTEVVKEYKEAAKLGVHVVKGFQEVVGGQDAISSSEEASNHP